MIKTEKTYTLPTYEKLAEEQKEVLKIETTSFDFFAKKIICAVVDDNTYFNIDYLKKVFIPASKYTVYTSYNEYRAHFMFKIGNYKTAFIMPKFKNR